jgi:hypothetical protein
MELRCKSFGFDVLQAIVDESLDASPHQGELHRPRVRSVRLSHDFRDMVGDNRLAETGQKRAGVGCRCTDCIFDLHLALLINADDGASPGGNGVPLLLFSSF